MADQMTCERCGHLETTHNLIWSESQPAPACNECSCVAMVWEIDREAKPLNKAEAE